jgi:hypothetical protein
MKNNKRSKIKSYGSFGPAKLGSVDIRGSKGFFSGRAVLLAVSIAAVCMVLLVSAAGPAQAYDRGEFSLDQQQAEQLAGKIRASEFLGPLAPVALSPFFGITCLSGTSILSSKGFLPENYFLQSSEFLNNPLVFGTFLALTLVTSVPKLTKGSKFFAETADQLEAYAGVITYGVIFLMAGDSLVPGGESEVVYSAGVFAFTKEALLVGVFAINIIVINTVKFFFELLVLLSPLPAVDAFFECCNKMFVTFLSIVYAFSPLAAMLVNIIIFIVCLAMFNWARKNIRYLRNLLLSPVIAKIFGIEEPDPAARRKSAELAGCDNVMCKCFPNRNVGKIKKKDKCFLGRGEDGLVLIRPRLFGGAVCEKIDAEKLTIILKKGLVSNVLQFCEPSGRIMFKLVFSKSYNGMLDEIKRGVPVGHVDSDEPVKGVATPVEPIGGIGDEVFGEGSFGNPRDVEIIEEEEREDDKDSNEDLK